MGIAIWERDCNTFQSICKHFLYYLIIVTGSFFSGWLYILQKKYRTGRMPRVIVSSHRHEEIHFSILSCSLSAVKFSITYNVSLDDQEALNQDNMGGQCYIYLPLLEVHNAHDLYHKHPIFTL